MNYLNSALNRFTLMLQTATLYFTADLDKWKRKKKEREREEVRERERERITCITLKK